MRIRNKLKISLFLFYVLLTNSAFGNSFTPDFDGTILKVDDRQLRPTKVINIGEGGTRIVDMVVSVQQNTVQAIRIENGTMAWQTQVPQGKYLKIVSDGQGIIFFQHWEKYKYKNYDRYRVDDTGEVHRLSVKDGTWLPTLRLGFDAITKKRRQILSLVATSDWFFVLDVVTGESDLHELQIKSSRISCFPVGDTKPKWQKTYKSAGGVPSVSVGILFQGDPLYVKPRLKMLSVVGETLIVCAGAVEDILALDLSTGEEKWRLRAVWEYQRGFIGPSVWRHFISRFGVDDLPDEKEIVDEEYKEEIRQTKKYMAEMREHLSASCRIVGGPVAILTPEMLREKYYKCQNCREYHGKKPNDQHRVFVAVSKATGNYGGYLEDCIVYEINDDGEPITMVNMPRTVLGSQFQICGDGVIWRCGEGSVAKLVPSKQNRINFMGPGVSDCIAHLAWYIHPSLDTERLGVSKNKSSCWLSFAKAKDLACFDGNVMFSLPAGGYIKSSEDQVFNFPISIISFPGKDPETMTLSIPFSGKIGLPKSNYRGYNGGIYSSRPLHMSIVGLEISNHQLIIKISLEDQGQTMLIFDRPGQKGV